MLLLATSHNITKTYIYKLNHLDLKPSKIVLLKWRNSTYSNKINELTRHDFSMLNSKIRSGLASRDLFTGDLSLSTEEILEYLGWEYETKIIEHINEEYLISFLAAELPEKYIVYCGGGILRKEILNCGKRFIHVHPGKVPSVKGADCFLWSSLVHKRIGMSAFFMNEGIDTGDIIDTKSYSIPNFEIDFGQLTTIAVRQLLINYVDPHYRAEMLGSLFNNIPNPGYWKTTRQYPSEGKTYYFMHDGLLPKAIKKFSNSKMKMVS